MFWSVAPPMFPSKDIVDNAVNSKDHITTNAAFTIPDVYQSNGVIHVINTVVMPD